MHFNFQFLGKRQTAVTIKSEKWIYAGVIELLLSVDVCVCVRVLPVADGLFRFQPFLPDSSLRAWKRFNIFQRSSWAFRDGETLIKSEGLFNVWWIIKKACFGLSTSVCHDLRSSPHTWHIHQARFTSVPFWLVQLLEKQSCSFFYAQSLFMTFI